MKAFVILNPHGGSAGDDASAQVREALAAAGVEAEIAEVAGGDAAQRAKRAAKDGAELIVAAGGDGTVSAVAGAVAGSKAMMGVIPLGTLNHFARDLGIPTKVADACKLLAAGAAKPVDLAELNGRFFINNSAIGLYPLMVMDREGQQKRLGRSKRLALLVAAIRTIARFHHHRLSLTVNDAKKRVDTPLLYVGNNDYRLDLGRAGQRDSLSDGRLCVFVMRSTGRLGLVAAAIRSLIGRAGAGDLVKLDDVERLTVDSHRSRLAVSLDGEVCHLGPPLDFRIRPQALRVVAP